MSSTFWLYRLPCSRSRVAGDLAARRAAQLSVEADIGHPLRAVYAGMQAVILFDRCGYSVLVFEFGVALQ